MSRAAISLLPKLSVLGNRRTEAVGKLVSKGLSSITDLQSQFLEEMLEYLRRHNARTNRLVVMEAIDTLSVSSNPQFHYISRGERKQIAVTSLIDLTDDSYVKVRWNKDGREIASSTTIDGGNAKAATVDISDFSLYHGGFYKLDIMYEDPAAGSHVIDTAYIVTRESRGVDSLLLPAPTFVSAVPAGDNEDTTITWTNPTHKDFKNAVLQTVDGLTLYRGNATSYKYYHDHAGNETILLFSEGSDGHVSTEVEIKLDSMVLSSDLTAGGTNFISLAESLASNPIILRDIVFLQDEPIQEVYLFGEGEVLVEGDTCEPALSWDGCKFPITINNFANVTDDCYSFKLEVYKCGDSIPFYTFRDFLRWDRFLVLFIPASQLTAFQTNVRYPYMIHVTSPKDEIQTIREGCIFRKPCDCRVPEVEGPNDHLWVTNMTDSESEAVAVTTSTCSCNA